MSVLSLGTIYRRDIYSLLPRADVEQWRLVSRHSNTLIESTPERRLPRRRVYGFTVASVSRWLFHGWRTATSK